MEKDDNGSRFVFYRGKNNGEYLLWLHKRLYELGYCKLQLPLIQTRLDHNKELYYSYQLKTFTFSSFNFIHSSFYENNTKIVPSFIQEYLSAEVLAIWIMDGATLINNKGLRFTNSNLKLNECKLLQEILKEKYDLDTSLAKLTKKVPFIYNIYVIKTSLGKLTKIVKPFIHPTMLYRLGLI